MRRAVLLVALAVLFGCGDPVKISNVDRQTPYAPALVRFAAKSGELAAVIHGSPFPAAMDTEAIARSIQLPGWLPRGTRLTTRPTPPTPSNIRVVLAFQPGWRGVREEWLCETGGKPEVGPSGGKITVVAVLCVDAKPVSWLQGQGESAASPAAKSFQNLMNQVMANLLPDRDL